MKTRRTHNVSFSLVSLFALFAIASPALVACGDSSTGSDDPGVSSVEGSSVSGSSDRRSSAAADSLNGSSRTMSSEEASSSSEEPFDPGEGNHAVRVSTYPADARIAIRPAKASAVADGESFTAWIELPAGALAHTGTLPGDRLDLNAETVPPEKRTKYSTCTAGEQSTVCPSKENPTV